MTTHRLPPYALTAIAIAPALLVSMATGVVDISWTTIKILAAFAVIWGVVFSVLSWRRLDETAREAQKFALFWGGSFSLALALAVLVFVPALAEYAGDRIEAILASQPDSPMRPSTYGFVIGAIYLGLAQIIGFLICWAGWWIAKR